MPEYFFVTHAKSNADFRRIDSAWSDRAQGIICNRTEDDMFYNQRVISSKLVAAFFEPFLKKLL